MEHDGAVAGRRLGVSIVDVSKADGNVLWRICHCGDKFGQTVCHTESLGHQQSLEEEQNPTDGGVDVKCYSITASGEIENQVHHV